jgi:membrane protein
MDPDPDVRMRSTAKRWLGIFRSAGSLWLEKNAFMHAGSLAFYTLFSLAPVVIIAVAIAGIFLGEEAARGEIVGQLQEYIGDEGAGAVETALADSRFETAGVFPTIAGILALIVGATTQFAQMQSSLNSIWGVKAKPERSGILVLLVTRLLSLTIVLSIGFILLVSFLLSIAVSAAIRIGADWIPFSGAVLTGADFLLSLVIVTLLFAMIFKVLPDVELEWSNVWAGALLTAFLFLVGRYGISFYLTYTAPDSTYGAAGSLVILLLWVYYSSLILLYGVAFTKARRLAMGRPIIPRKLAVRVREEVVETPEPAGVTG